jgi:CheY-like chemotaxis protein
MVVLVVEDEVLVRFALADYLRECGLKVYEARCAEEAIQLLSFYKGEIDVVFSDLKLPGGMDGFELAAWLKRHRPELPFVLTSGEARMAQAAALNTAFIRKPYDLKVVLGLLQHAANDALGEGRSDG